MSTFGKQAAGSHLVSLQCQSRKSCQEGTSVGEVSEQSSCKKVWLLLRKQDGPARSQGSQKSAGLLDLHTLNAELGNK